MDSHVAYYFFFNDTATTEIYTLSLHDALPIYGADRGDPPRPQQGRLLHQRRAGPHRARRRVRPRELERRTKRDSLVYGYRRRSEEHTSELQSRQYLVCRLLLEK